MANSWESLLDGWEKKLQQAFQESIYQIRNQAQIDKIARMLERGDVDGAVRAVGLDPAQFRGFDKAIADAFESGGNATARSLPVTLSSSGLRAVFHFNVRNVQAETWLREYSGTLIKDIMDDQRTMIRNAMETGMKRGANPRTTALELVGRVSRATGHREGGMIGLTDSQAQWVQNYADELASDDPLKALARELRDKRFDKTVIRAQREGRALTTSEIEPMVNAYRTRALRLRAESIARKETITAMHVAQEMAMQQAMASGKVNATDVTYVWRTAHDKRVRDSHRVMDGQVRKQGQDFITGSGAHLRFPGDPYGPAAETINCRCVRIPRVDYLAGIK